MNQALLSKQATEDNTPFPYGTIHRRDDDGNLSGR
jgi:hypothetical protein